MLNSRNLNDHVLVIWNINQVSSSFNILPKNQITTELHDTHMEEATDKQGFMVCIKYNQHYICIHKSVVKPDYAVESCGML